MPTCPMCRNGTTAPCPGMSAAIIALLFKFSAMGISAHILVVDDEPEIAGLLRGYLAGQGYTVSTAESGAAMRRIMAEANVDLVLLDLGLPGEDGLALMRSLREASAVAVIVVTGRGEPVDRIVGLEVGADDYVTKPFANWRPGCAACCGGRSTGLIPQTPPKRGKPLTLRAGRSISPLAGSILPKARSSI